MNRRQMLSAVVLAPVIVAGAHAAEPAWGDYTRDAYEEAVAGGGPLLLNFYDHS